MMKNSKIHILLIAIACLLTACDSYLDVVPKGDIENIDTEFEKRENAQNWMKTCYIPMVNALNARQDPALLGSDEYCAGDFGHNMLYSQSSEKQFPALQIASGNQIAQNPYCNVWVSSGGYWEAIRYCNIFLDKIGETGMAADEKKQWIAQVKAVKAYYYFDLMRRYGPIPLIDHNHDVAEDSKAMQSPRQPIDSIVNSIVRLCDEAIPDLPAVNNKDADNQLLFSKESTAYVKAMTLLYAASPLFNGAELFRNMKNKDGVLLFPQKYDKEKWHKAAIACDEAITYCENYGLKLCSGDNTMANSITNTMKDIEHTWIGEQWDNKEALLTMNAWYPFLKIGLDMYCMPRQEIDTQSEWYDQESLDKSCLAAPIKMVERFYTDHGLPISEDRQWMVEKYGMSKETDERYRHVVPIGTNILNLHRRREPRFYAMILCDGSVWYRKTSKGIYEDLTADCKKGGSIGEDGTRVDGDAPQNLTGYYIKKWISSDIQLLNYTGRANFHSKYRYVFRLPELYLASAEAWNEYLDAPNQHVYDMIDVVRKRAGIPGVVEAWTTYSRNPNNVFTKNGFRDIVHQEWDIEFMFEGRRYYNLRRWMTAPQELNQPQTGWNIFGRTPKEFYNNFNGPVKVWTKNKFEAPKDYFFPIKAEEILISGQKQNPGW